MNFFWLIIEIFVFNKYIYFPNYLRARQAWMKKIKYY